MIKLDFTTALYVCYRMLFQYGFVSYVLQVVTEHETEVRNSQEQSSRLQTELNRLRQELQDKASQEETLRQQMAEKEEKTKKALVYARQKIAQVTGERASIL